MNSVERLSILYLAKTPSTNSHAKQILPDLLGHLPCFLMAETQSLGRGRDRRVWDSPPGGFYGTLVWEIPPHPPLSYGLLSLLAGLSVWDLLRELLPNHPFDLKWPNDILCRGRKIAGILVENQIRGDQWISFWGSGINLDRRQSPFSQELSPTAVSASDLGETSLCPLALAPRLYTHTRRWLNLWLQGEIATIMKTLDTASRVFHQAPITVHDHGEIRRGIFEGIDEQGTLRLKGADGEIRHCTTGEIRKSEG